MAITKSYPTSGIKITESSTKGAGEIPKYQSAIGTTEKIGGGAIELRAYIFLDQMQPQLASQVASTSRGYLPVVGQASIVVEIAPGIEINRLTDIAVKATDVMPGNQVVERAFGMLEFHHDDQGAVLQSGKAILDALAKTEMDRLKPRILTSQLVRRVHDYQCQLINRTSRSANYILPGETLYILEVHPAGYANFAANEAEKASNIKLIEVRNFGAFGRLYFCGDERDVEVGMDAVHRALDSVTGRENAPSKKE
jgi:hypothetical protein